MEALVLSIAGALIIILLGIIGYFIVKDKEDQKATNTKLFDLLDKQRESTEKLNISISGLNAVLLVMQEKSLNFEKRYEDHKDVCKEKFKIISADEK
jgi:hypothetical protein